MHLLMIVGGNFMHVCHSSDMAVGVTHWESWRSHSFTAFFCMSRRLAGIFRWLHAASNPAPLDALHLARLFLCLFSCCIK
jgi:hypothetical protein